MNSEYVENERCLRHPGFGSANRHAVPPEPPFDAHLNMWYRECDSPPDFLSRLASRSTLASGRRKIYVDSPHTRNFTIESSLVVEAVSEDDSMSNVSTTATEAVPALTRGSSTASSAGTAETGAASALDGGYLLESHEGVLTVPNRFQPDADLLCPFQILDCQEVFSEVVDFKTHVFSHFKGHNAPKKASCFLCDMKFTQTPQEHAAMAWNKMLSHLANDHFRQGQRLATVRTDFSLMRWMYGRRIIDDAQFKRTQMCPIPIVLPTSSVGEIVNTPMAPMAPPVQQTGSGRSHFPVSVGLQSEAFTLFASRRVDRRRREATRASMSHRGNL
jgi:hypothetical protein